MADDLLERGMKLYEERLKSELEPEHNGEMLAVDVESGDYFLGRRGIEAYDKAVAKHPGKQFAFLRVGARTHAFRGGLLMELVDGFDGINHQTAATMGDN